MALIIDYTEAKKKYFASDGYKNAIDKLTTYGVPMKVAENILINAFAAGWNKRK